MSELSDKPHTLIACSCEDIDYTVYPSFNAAHEAMQKFFDCVAEGGEDPMLSGESYISNDYAVFYGEDRSYAWKIAEGTLL